MKKFLLVLVAALVIALGIWIVLRVEQANRRLAVAELLPKTTVFFAEVPDFKRAREQWHASDLYAIWREPAVQTWLQKPIAQLRRNRNGKATFEDFLQLEPTDGFVALTSIESNEPKIVGGFRSNKSAAEVRSFVEARENPLLAKSGGGPRATISYQQHQIETVNAGRSVIASVFDRDWFFVANDLPGLKALIDRADRRVNNPRDSLRDSDAFQTSATSLPSAYAAMFFFTPQPFLEKLMPLVSMTGQPVATSQLQKLKSVRSLAATFGFDKGKMTDSLFVSMPRLGPAEKLTRPSLASADTNTFFYSASVTHGPSGWQLPTASASPMLPQILQQFSAAMAGRGISQADIRAAFGDEIEIVGQWQPAARWPTLFASMPVKDANRARKIVDALTSVGVAGAAWTRTDKDGVSLYSLPALGGLMPVSLTMAISGKKLVAGSDAAAVAEVITSTKPPADSLGKSEKFRDAVALVPAADTAFEYIDTRLLFDRIDATLRPLLLMSATIYPALGNKINAAQLPPSDVIAKHLSPIVMSQRYTGDGYLSESVGPVTFNEATVGAAGLMSALYIYLHRGLKLGSLLPSTATAPAPPAAASPTPIPTPP